MMENVLIRGGERVLPPNGGDQKRADMSMRRKLQGLEVLTRALLRRIESLREDAVGSGAVNIADEVQRFEAELIISALIETGGRQRRAARLLGMNITTLNRKLRRYSLKTSCEASVMDSLDHTETES